MSNGTCCSASQRMTSRASASFILSIWIFLTITSRPPTAVTTDFRLTPAASTNPNSLRNEAGVHDFALDDGVGGTSVVADFSQFGFTAPVVDDHEV